jgi:hypothetical protein
MLGLRRRGRRARPRAVAAGLQLARLALGVGLILTPPCVSDSRFSVQTVQGGIGMTVTSAARLGGLLNNAKATCCLTNPTVTPLTSPSLGLSPSHSPSLCRLCAVSASPPSRSPALGRAPWVWTDRLHDRICSSVNRPLRVPCARRVRSFRCHF